MSTENKAGLGLAVHWIQQALITACEDNCPLRPAKNGRRRLFNRCWADNKSSSWELYRELNGDIGRRYARFPKRPGGPSVAPLTHYLGRLGYTGIYLGTLKLGWDPWWLLPESVCNPRGKPWISCLLLTSLTQLLWQGVWYPPLPAVPHMWTGG